MFRNPFRKSAQKNQTSIPVSGRLESDLANLKKALGGKGAQIVVRRFTDKYCLVYINVMVNEETVNRDVAAHLPALLRGVITPDQVPVREIRATGDLKKAAREVLMGCSALLIGELKEVYIYDTRGVPKRIPEESPTERTTRGGRSGFIEDLDTNLALIRRNLSTPQLEVDLFTLGELVVTRGAMVYVNNIADPGIVEEVRRRLKKIKGDNVLATGTIEANIEDHPWSLFPQALNTEKPNRVAANLMEGRVAVFLDGTSNVLVVPAVFPQFMQGIEDYFDRFWVGNFTRVLRFVGLVVAITLTPSYIALVTYHHELLPLELLMAVAEHRREAPFPPIVEALLMEMIIEFLREAGLRLPNPLGQTMGVVGGIILGQAIIQARIVGPLIVIVVSVSAVASFIIPNYSASLGIRLVKYPLMLLSSLFGAIGISLGIILFITHQASMRSFGVPYMSPLAPFRFRDMEDSVVVSHTWKMRRRPDSIPHQKDKRITGTPRGAGKK